MYSSGFDYQQFLWSVLYMSPQLLCYAVAIVFCLIRRRENPKGATFLGLAVLVSLSSTLLGRLWPFLLGPTAMSGYLSYVFMAFFGITAIVFWSLIIAAVFARTPHYDLRDQSMFEATSTADSQHSNPFAE